MTSSQHITITERLLALALLPIALVGIAWHAHTLGIRPWRVY